MRNENHGFLLGLVNIVLTCMKMWAIIIFPKITYPPGLAINLCQIGASAFPLKCMLAPCQVGVPKKSSETHQKREHLLFRNLV